VASLRRWLVSHGYIKPAEPKRGPRASGDDYKRTATAGDRRRRASMSAKIDLRLLEMACRVAQTGGMPTVSTDAAVVIALIGRIRELEAALTAHGSSLANFVGEDKDEAREISAMSTTMLALVEKGVTT
jgi:hypothetical protein